MHRQWKIILLVTEYNLNANLVNLNIMMVANQLISKSSNFKRYDIIIRHITVLDC